MGKENRLYSISLGVASLQGGLVGVATALSPATCRPFQVLSPSFFVGLELILFLSSSGSLPHRSIGRNTEKVSVQGKPCPVEEGLSRISNNIRIEALADKDSIAILRRRNIRSEPQAA